jgi:prepilin-type N-terminal cleavage/methylation domain-containing protein
MTRASRAGFTLIEVVGAVAIVGIWFLILSTAAFNGIAAESRSQRRLEASLIADEVLADAEAQMLLGLPVELDADQYGDLDADGIPEYVVVIESTPFDPRERLVPAGPAASGVPFVDPRAGASRGDAAADALTMERIQIDVHLEADFERDDEEVPVLASRTTWAIEPTSLDALAPTAAPPGAPGGAAP